MSGFRGHVDQRFIPAQRSPSGVPPAPAAFVSRPRLTALLQEGVAGALTLVTAPAGTGKTVAVAEWARVGQPPGPVVWVRWDGASGADFWRLVVASQRRCGVDVPLTPPMEASGYTRAFLFDLAANLLRRGEPVVLVLDADAALPDGVAAGLDFVLRHCADRLRLVLVSREPSTLPRYRYLLAGTATEVTMSDLAFTFDEAEAVLAERGLDLPGEVVAALLARTRGWVVGLVLAAMVVTHADRPAAAAAGITGDSGAIAEYLLAEVLEAQPAGLRELLLTTSVAAKLEPGLVEQLTGPSGPPALTFLARSNAFIDPVPDQPGCYRYHPLFAELLRARFRLEAPAEFRLAHGRAAAWYAAQGRVNEAVRHAVAAGSWEDAAVYAVETLAITELPAPAPSALVSLFEPMPTSVGGFRPALVRAAVAAAADDQRSARQYLEDAEASPDPADRSDAAVLAAAMLRAQLSDDPEDKLAASDACERLLSGRDRTQPGRRPEIVPRLAAIKGSALLARGNLNGAAGAYALGATAPHVSGPAAATIDCVGQQALIAAWTGQLRSATALASQALERRERDGLPLVPGVQAAETALAWVSVERHDLPAFRRHEIRADVHGGIPGPRGSSPLLPVALSIARARALRMQGLLTRAGTVLAEPWLSRAEVPAWLRAFVQVELATLRLAEGRLDAADSLSSRTRVPSPEALLLRSQVALARGHDLPVPRPILTGQHATLATQVAGLLTETTRLVRTGQQLQATEPAERALRLARAEQMRRPLLLAPSEVHELLGRHPDLITHHRWLWPRRMPGSTPHRPPTVMVPLSPREQEVLVLLDQLFTTEEIADRLLVSVNTIRTHIRSILDKLGAHRRNEAVRTARDMGLLPAGHPDPSRQLPAHP
jgi:LuxR family maltose regulon positive regulatory protein